MGSPLKLLVGFIFVMAGLFVLSTGAEAVSNALPPAWRALIMEEAFSVTPPRPAQPDWSRLPRRRDERPGPRPTPRTTSSRSAPSARDTAPSVPKKSSTLPKKTVPRPKSGRKLFRNYRWEDKNGLVARRDGERVYYRAGQGKTFRLQKVPFDESDVRRGVEGFGLEKSRLRYSYYDEAERRQKLAELRRYGESRGMQLSADEQWQVNYRWLVSRSASGVASLTERILQLARRRGYKDNRQFYGLIASFVQSLRYDEIESTRRDAAGREVLTAGMITPLQGLVEKRGDCDSFGTLYGSLMANVKGAEVVMLIAGAPIQHAFVGVLGVGKKGDRVAKLGNKTYVLVELTSGFPFGTIPNQEWQRLRRYKVVRLTP